MNNPPNKNQIKYPDLSNDPNYQNPQQMAFNWSNLPPPIDPNQIQMPVGKDNLLDNLKNAATSGLTNILKEPLIQQMEGQMTNIKNQVIKQFNEADEVFKRELTKNKQKLNNWIRIKIEQAVIDLLTKLRPVLIEQLIDPYMCLCVKNLINDLVNEMWPEIEEEVLVQLEVRFNVPYDEKVNIKPDVYCLFYPCFLFKSWYLYTLYPFDRSIWKQFRTISYWIITIVNLFPFYGVQSFLFAFQFLMIDKSDEFQLVSFVLKFKKMQFITIGAIGGSIGYFTFYSCATYNNDQSSNCAKQGPGIYLNFYTDIIGFIIQLLLIWLCFCMLPCSKEKGRPKYQYNSPVLKADLVNDECLCFGCTCHTDRGGRLKTFLIYDMCCATLCVLGVLLLLFVRNQSDWQIKSTLYLCKTAYGLLSFPFLIFLIPEAPYFITKSRDTAYDKYGHCVPLIKNLKSFHTKIKEQGQQNELFDPMYASNQEEKKGLLNKDFCEGIA